MTGTKLLRTWVDHCQIYRVLHSTASNYYETWDARYKIPAILLTSVGAGLAFSVQVFPEETTLYVPVIVGVLNLVAGTFTSVSSFKRTAERAEGHRLSSVAFSKLRRKIQEKLILTRGDVPDDFVTSIREDFDGLIESGPEIPEVIIEAFHKAHPNDSLKLKKPAIIDLGGLDVAHLRQESVPFAELRKPKPMPLQRVVLEKPIFPEEEKKSEDAKLISRDASSPERLA